VGQRWDNLRAEQLGHRRNRRPLHRGEYVLAGVERLDNRGMPQAFADDLHVDVRQQEQGGAGVPQIVQADARQLRAGEDARECLVQVAREEPVAGAVGEDDALRNVPAFLLMRCLGKCAGYRLVRDQRGSWAVASTEAFNTSEMHLGTR
jgi:hypothetical protein